MTTSANKINLPGLSFCSYRDSPQTDVGNLKQAVAALENATKHVQKLEGPARAEGFRMIHELEQALLAAGKEKTHLRDFTNEVNVIIQKLGSFPKLFPINREAAKSGLRSAQEKITNANLPQKAPEKAKASYQAGPAGGSPEQAGRVYQQHAGKAQAKAEKPNQPELAAASKNEDSSPGVFTLLAAARCAAEAAAHSPLGVQAPGTGEADLSKGKYSLMGTGAALTVLLAGPPAAAHAEAWADLRLIEAQTRNARAAERLYSFRGVEPPPKVTPERASARSNLRWKERQSKFVRVFGSMVKTPRAGGIAAFVLQGIGITRDLIDAYNNPSAIKEEGKEPGSDLIA